ncbi:protein phosphatase 1 regulatory inhibitor subunit 16B [Coccinella septempunctata]|uniref:protein phosphatase 1 regulatory inhibitor subunit 16B n=1 Tax=Coccinella septempunctata TaxID=41139 RepID=UPI001D081BBE|nr:protein phosphatase 1 regulatory inhibitor subunit 16B [Coccinella septempunctata]XP_044747554.1 protein phosphatase 1 regulatory inhibitor subunit 16B [Coccinella septempunctata]XP_044747564.1 protein phosphatase 1 regulatory inhibitor subunit 16B [Coccinella septempunctata]XP_044747569.1 protein phosphatase 1 regulatory inhibitor subunit 16B [Coccinella septempunctata]XP_044747579.1 protein phosphatase 1 regulatory inhibitor subunit 16B [Coccinella septempunctata]
MEHADLIQEMPHIEQMPTQERLILAKKRRNHQLKVWSQKEKEYSKKTHKPKTSNKRNIFFSESVVLLEAASRNDIDEVRRLLTKGVSPDSCNEDGLTALHQCCIDNNEAMLNLLLEFGANVNAEDSEKWTPLHAAATCGFLRLIKILIDNGANLLAVNADGNMPYDICEDNQALDCIEIEMDRRGITQQLIDETRASTERQMLADLEMKGMRGEDLEAYDIQGATPLHIAAANGYISVVEFLLEHGVRTDAKDKDDWQPAHAAACWGHLEVIELLAQAGADLNAKNKHDETPFDICEDIELKERILELKTEQEIKRQAEAKRKVRRSQSNTRTQSVRRTSLRDKGMTSRKDAVEEARLRLEAESQKALDTTDDPQTQSKPPKVPISNNVLTLPAQPKLKTNNEQTKHEGNLICNNNEPADADKSFELERRTPEGKDSDSLLESPIAESNENSYTTDVNGKVTVHVVVTINGNGTLADLKKQRMQIRNNSGDVSTLSSPVNSIPDNDSATVPTTDVVRFTGETTQENVGYSKSKRCCVIQ